jgi:hypothetical protein
MDSLFLSLTKVTKDFWARGDIWRSLSTSDPDCVVQPHAWNRLIDFNGANIHFNGRVFRR